MNSRSVIKVLLVEDNEDHAILINSTFLKYGEKYKLSISKTITEAKTMLEGKDIILTNLSLSDGTGLEFLKDIYIYDNIPVIVLESFVEQETVVKLIKSGVMDYINKSTEAFETLPEKINKYLELRDLRRERKKTSDQQNKLSIAINHSSEAIMITDKHGMIEFVNPSFEKTTGFSSEEVMGKPPSLLKSGQHDKKFYENIVWMNRRKNIIISYTIIFIVLFDGDLYCGYCFLRILSIFFRMNTGFLRFLSYFLVYHEIPYLEHSAI